MNILKNYNFKIGVLTYYDINKALHDNHDKYKIITKGCSYFIEDSVNNRLYPFKCIVNYYTNSPDNKPLKISNNNSKCFNIRRTFNILNECNQNECKKCHRLLFRQYKENNANLINK